MAIDVVENVPAILRLIAFVGERHEFRLRMDAFNAPNHPNFWTGDQNINSTLFGVVAANFNPRIMQFGLRYKF